jgi:hypothetical protein
VWPRILAIIRGKTCRCVYEYTRPRVWPRILAKIRGGTWSRVKWLLFWTAAYARLYMWPRILRSIRGYT